MIRTSAKMTALAALALAGGAVGLNCSKSSNPGDSGALKIAFAIPDGTTISSVHYAITSSPGNVAGPAGSFDTSDKNASASFDIALQPTAAGVTDVVVLTATTSAGVACLGTSAPFTITSNAPTAVNMSLICGTGTATSLPGTVDVRATVTTSDNCPNITQAIVAPAQTSVGSTISVSAVASDSDAGDALTYTWGPSANFTNPVGTSDTYTCTTAGAQTITLTVDDHHTGGNCTASITLPVTCVAVAVCGNGIVEPGETCDPPNGTTCDATCHTIVPATGGTTGTGGTATGGTTGTGGVAATGGVVGTGGVPATGGVVGTGGVPATGGTTGTGGTFAQDNAACVTCEKAGSSARCTLATYDYAAPGTFGCDSFPNAGDRANCLSLVACLRSTACQQVIAAAGSDYSESQQKNGDPFPCLCNTATTTITSAACSAASSWSGVCASAYVLAESTQAAPDVLGDFYSNDTPTGVASNLMSCDIESTNKCTSASTCSIPQ